MLETYTLPERFARFEPFPEAGARSGWESLPDDLRGALIRRGEAFLDFDWPTITARDWLAYTRTGDRSAFEAKYFSRRRALCALTLAECAEYGGRFLDEVVNGVVLICEESGWQLPAHNSYIRDTAALPLPDTARPLLDLFACETGALLAACRYLLDGALEAVSPVLTARIQQELDARIIQPYLDNWFWWMGGNGEPTLNWTVWCTQNVLLTAFLSGASDDVRHRVAKKSIASLDAFLDDYGEDGCCDEGAQYYRHAGLCLNGALEVLDYVTDGLFAPVWSETKIKNIARYILNVHVGDKYYINFADCAPVAGRAGVREHRFGKRCGDSGLCDFALSDWNAAGCVELPDEINLFYRAQAVFAATELSALPVPEQVAHREIYYASTGLFIARDDVRCLAVKAGDNNDNHNHNDTGSFTLYKNGAPFVIDAGVETYSAKTFSPQRYELWTMQSSYHNLPEFDGVMQCAGADFCAKDVDVSFAEAESAISMRLEDAWPSGSGLTSFSRKVTLLKGKAVLVEDVCAGAYQDAVLNLMFCAKPIVDDDVLRFSGLGEIRISGASGIDCESIPVTDARLRVSWPQTLFRVRIRFKNTISLTIR